MKRKVLTLCMLHDSERILLGMKKRGFGAGKWNSFGGKVEEGESIENAMLREVKEEAGIDVNDFERRGKLEFVYEKDLEIWEVHLFSAKKFIGEIRESEEMMPKWFNHEDVPYEKMWEDDLIWLPSILKGNNIFGRFFFDSIGSDKIVRHEFIEDIKA